METIQNFRGLSVIPRPISWTEGERERSVWSLDILSSFQEIKSRNILALHVIYEGSAMIEEFMTIVEISENDQFVCWSSDVSILDISEKRLREIITDRQIPLLLQMNKIRTDEDIYKYLPRVNRM